MPRFYRSKALSNSAIQFPSGQAFQAHFQIIEQVQSECREVQEAWKEGNRAHLQEEIGDLIQAAIPKGIPKPTRKK